MKIYTNERGPKWTKYYEDNAPKVLYHATGQITLMSPSNDEEKVNIHTPEENLFVLVTFKKILVEWFSLVSFQERVGDLFVKYTRTNDVPERSELSVYRRSIHETQFHCVTNQSAEFIVAALELIEAQRTRS